MIDVIEAINAGKTLADIAIEIGAMIKKAFASPDAVPRVLLYLNSARAAVQALGHERQQILTAMGRADLRDDAAVDVIWQRLDSYLHEDRIRLQLQAAIGGLKGCLTTIERQSSGLAWRGADKRAATALFVESLAKLDSMLEGLVSNFYPGGSGMGVETLRAPHEILAKLRGQYRHGKTPDAVAAQKDLDKLVRLARNDASDKKWVRLSGEVEKLIAELSLAFRQSG